MTLGKKIEELEAEIDRLRWSAQAERYEELAEMVIREIRASPRGNIEPPDRMAVRLNLSKNFVRGVVAAARVLGRDGTDKAVTS